MEDKPEVKQLYRSRTNRKLAGVCGGIGEYFNIDPVIVRLLWMALTLLAGWGILVYILAIILIPNHPDQNKEPVNTER